MHKKVVQMYKEIYKKGTRVECISMDDHYCPIAPGTKGTVVMVDDIGTIHMKWDNGRTLGLVPGEDQFMIIKED